MKRLQGDFYHSDGFRYEISIGKNTDGESVIERCVFPEVEGEIVDVINTKGISGVTIKVVKSNQSKVDRNQLNYYKVSAESESFLSEQ